MKDAIKMRRVSKSAPKEDYNVGIRLSSLDRIYHVLYCMWYYIYLQVQKLSCISLRREKVQYAAVRVTETDRKKYRRGMKKLKTSSIDATTFI